MSETLKSNAALDEAINGATNFEQMRERALATLAAQGTIVRDRTDAYSVRVVGQPQTDAPLPATADAPREDHNKVFRVIYPRGNDRFEIFGATEQELDQKEANIRAMFPAAR